MRIEDIEFVEEQINEQIKMIKFALNNKFIVNKSLKIIKEYIEDLQCQTKYN